MTRATSWMIRGSRAARSAIAVLGTCACVIAFGATDPLDDRLASARERMDAIQREIAGNASLDSLSRAREEALTIEADTSRIAVVLTPELANVDARIAELGAPLAGTESDGIAAQRKTLGAQHDRTGARLKLARLLSIEAGQAVEQIAKVRRSRWTAQLGERSRSILGGAFWTELAEGWSRDRPAFDRLWQQFVDSAKAVPLGIWLVMVLVVGAAIAAAAYGRRLLLAFAAKRIPQGRIRRSLVALASTLIAVGAAAVCAQAVRSGLVFQGPAPPELTSALRSIASGAIFGAFVAALGRALMSPARPSWRLPDIPDPLADRLRHEPIVLGVVIAMGAACEDVAANLGAAAGTTTSIEALFTLALALVIVMALRRGESMRHRLVASAASVPPRPLALFVIVFGSWSLLTISLICILIGYVALGSLLVKQTTWVLIVATSSYLLAAFVDDACTAWLGVEDDGDGAAESVSPLRRQAAVLLSAVLRVVIVVIAIATVFGPLEQGTDEILQRAERLQDGIAVGEIRVLPGAVLEAIAVLVGGMFLVRAAQKWFLERFLPTTGMDAGMRSSTSTLLGYVGVVFVVALALSALGIGLERVAWVASALSVGIGFGLQAVVSNFVSGLILLTERPVKVGDLVSLGGVEGDIRRINVRATEIQMSDRSTVIVPNSEFITKVVRNVTHASPLGLVQIKLPLPLDADVERMRALALAILAEHESVVDHPAPAVQLEGIDAASLLLTITGSVGSPRQIGSVRSELLFTILSRMKAEGLSLARPAVLFREPESPAMGTVPADDAG